MNILGNFINIVLNYLYHFLVFGKYFFVLDAGGEPIFLLLK